MQTTIMRHSLRLLLLGVSLIALCSCYDEEYDEATDYADGKVGVSLNIQTRAISSTSETYVEGTEWENYIDIAGGDYRIYFFEYDPDTETGSGNGANSKLIAEFAPTDIMDVKGSNYTTYTLSGEVDENLISSLANFKVLVIANWGSYPSVTAGTTTIDDICNAGTYSAFVDNGVATLPSSSRRIPFFGLREYSNVTWTPNRRTTLSGAITMLRAVAKVEVVLENTDVTFTEININNYNATGYCAPTGVYLHGDYDHDGAWASDFTSAVHLVNNGGNDSNQSGRTIAMYKTTNDEGYETWVAYLPEYNNMSTDYCYISARFDYQTSTEETNKIYFANYTSGSTTAYDDGAGTSNRFDVYRNYLYRFHVALSGYIFQVYVEKWQNTYENDFQYGVVQTQ